MAGRRPRVGVAGSKYIRETYMGESDLRRLHEFADFTWAEFNERFDWNEPPKSSPAVVESFIRFAAELDALVLGPGAPRVTAEVLEKAPRLRAVGELEGDRFAQLIDLEACASCGVKALDTTHGSSYPVSEWALGLTIIGLRNAGKHFRDLIAHRPAIGFDERGNEPGFLRGELTGKLIGLIGCGHIGRRLLEYLRPFKVRVLVYDPYLSREIADVLDFDLTTLDNVLIMPDVVVCLAPLTSATRGMLGAREIALLRPGAVFVNVSRGAIVNSNALIARLRKGDIIASLDVFDPEPIPVDSPVRELENVFLSPHVAGVTLTSRTRFFSLMVDELRRLFAGHETRHDLTSRVVANRQGSRPPPR